MTMHRIAGFQGPLAGITVVDMTHVLSGPYATQILRRLGARVIKIERPGSGDDARAFGPFVQGQSTYFTALNGGKESLVLDLDQAEDRRLLHRLLARADVFVENFRPGVLQRHGLDQASLRRRYPRLIYGSVTGFGQNGPYRQRPAYDIIVQAMSGLMSVTGQPGGEPTRVGVSIGDMAAGLYLAIGLCAALFERTRSGRGSYVDIAMLDCQVALLENLLTGYLATGHAPGPLGTRHPSIAPFAAFRAADAYLVIAAANDALFAKLCRALERPDLLEDARFHSNELRHRHVDALTRELEQILSSRPARQWMDRLQQAGVPCGPLNTLAEVVKDAQLAARHMIVPVEGSEGQCQVAGNPIKLEGLADAASFPAAPELGGDQDRLLREFAAPEAQLS
jgi:CoA:oxalate CoA-transferase